MLDFDPMWQVVGCTYLHKSRTAMSDGNKNEPLSLSISAHMLLA
jgi:hypothetical protein